MDLLQMLSDALRNFKGPPKKEDPNAAQKILGGSGVASRVSGATRGEYMEYVQQEIGTGNKPLSYSEWAAQREPLTSQIGGR